MSEENIEVLKRSVEAYNQRDMDTLLDLASPNYEFAPLLATVIETTTYRGHEGLRKYFEDADSTWGEIQVRFDDVRDAGGDLVYACGELYGKGRASGLEVQVPLACVAEVRDGKLTRLQSYETADEALKAAGLSA